LSPISDSPLLPSAHLPNPLTLSPFSLQKADSGLHKKKGKKLGEKPGFQKKSSPISHRIFLFSLNISEEGIYKTKENVSILS